MSALGRLNQLFLDYAFIYLLFARIVSNANNDEMSMCWDCPARLYQSGVC